MALRIPTAHNYCVISACSRVRAHTQHNIQILMVALALRETNHRAFLSRKQVPGPDDFFI